MEVVGVRVELPSNTPIVLLREIDGRHRMLPIFIGGPEATAIALALDEVATPRPMTHDLMKNLLDEFEVGFERLDITALDEGTFYAEMHLKRGEASLVISSRPSDGIALAIRTGTPIYAADEVVEAAAYTVDEEAEPEDVVEQFREFIDSVNPEDFAS
ncbi:MAG TPA: bifunctional nuclease family protein [Acidimicrobiales bacterium]